MDQPPPLTHKRIAPLSAGKILGLLYAAMGLLFIPFFLVMAMTTAHLPAAQRSVFAFVGVGMAFAAPVLYGVMGFLVGIIGAALYNLLARLIGGIEVEVV